jgi:hypothetical protein
MHRVQQLQSHQAMQMHASAEGRLARRGGTHWLLVQKSQAWLVGVHAVSAAVHAPSHIDAKLAQGVEKRAIPTGFWSLLLLADVVPHDTVLRPLDSSG